MEATSILNEKATRNSGSENGSSESNISDNGDSTLNHYHHSEDTIFSPKVSMIPSCDKPGDTADVLLEKIIEGTRNGRWKNIVDKGRSKKTDKKKYLSFKSSSVPAYTLHGTASYASNEGMKQSNGLAGFDLDNLWDKELLKDKLTRDPYTFLLHDSFGGNGLILYVRIPKVANAEEFEVYHSSFREYLLNEYRIEADEGAKSYKCLRLVSYDPNLFHNKSAMVWKNLPTLKPQKKKVEPRPENNHYADILPVVAKLGHNGFTDEEIKQKLGGIHIDPKSCLNDPLEVDKLIDNVRKHYTEGKEGIGRSAVQYCGFWTNNFKNTDVQLSTGLLTDVLTALGWRIFDDEYVQIVDGVVYKKEDSELYETVINLVTYQDVIFTVKDLKIVIDRTTLKTRAQKELKGSVKMFALKKFDYPILRDGSAEAYFHFQNKSLKVTRETFYLIDRNECEGVVWFDQLLPHPISEDDMQRPVFADFLMNVSGPDNFNSFRSAIGRALHNYNGSEGMRVPWFCDESHKAGESNGRTGKSLITKGIGKCRKMDDCHGKDFKSDNQFKFQNVSPSTQVYCIDDVKENFDFKALYNVTSEGMEYEKKNRARVRVPLKETPQLLVTSNHPPQIEQGASTTGRLFILPVKSFYQQYADEGGVKAYHKQTFFDDWNETEWNRFFWFMAVCTQYYLQHGYVFADQSQIRKNRLKEICSKKLKGNELADDFVEWLYQYSLPDVFSLKDLLTDFKPDIEDGELQVYSTCLVNYFNLERVTFSKAREGRGESRKVIWRISKR